MRRRSALLTVLVVLVMLVAACGDDDTGTAGTAGASGTTAGAAGDSPSTTAPSDSAAGGGSSDAGVITFGGETIALDSVRCYLQPQDAAAGGGQILATAQGFGTNAAGDQISLDFTRFSQDSQFAGDDISITVGDPFSESSVGYLGSGDIGSVSIEGSTVSVTGFALNNSDDFSEVQADVEIHC